ncbi:hypothetical protein NMG60_11023374 [Bertholletia excelsa]
MEPAKIDWKNINSVFVVDDLYEHFNAPKWVDFSAPDESVDDEAWFCRPDCNHPKTVEDFHKISPPSKLQRSASVSQIHPLGDRSRRDANLKRRGLAQPSNSSNKEPSCNKFTEDGENQNPNLSAAPSHQYNIMKAVIKSNTEKGEIDNPSRKEEIPQLKSTMSARNLLGGRDILNQITELYNEFKRLASRAKGGENTDKSNVKKSPTPVKKREIKEFDGDNLGKINKGEERKPLFEVSKEKREALKKSNVKEKQRRRVDEAENIPVPVDLKNIKRREGENLLPIRTCPPSPQCFSAGRGPGKAVPLKASRSKPMERGILQELEQSDTQLKKEEAAADKTPGRSISVVAERGEARTLDVFWFLKPCTLSS